MFKEMAQGLTIDNWSVLFENVWWQEYPQIDRENIHVYPTDLKKISPDEIWKKKPLTLYLHIPFCKHKCKYCFLPRCEGGEQNVKQYLDALHKEIEMYAGQPYIQDHEIFVIHMGGGSPTSLEINELTALVQKIFQSFNIRQDVQFTIEAEPTTVDREKLSVLVENGVNRISFGVQSFLEKNLEKIGLAHRFKLNTEVIEMARKAGFQAVGIDLMYRFPEQTLKDFDEDIRIAAQHVRVDSISMYSLSIIPGTPMFEENYEQPEEQLEIDMYKRALSTLVKYGYQLYSHQDFGKKGKENFYIKNIWSHSDLETIGLGLGGISYLINGHIYMNQHNLEKYLTSINNNIMPIMMGKKITTEEMMSRFFVINFLSGKVDKELFKQLYNCPVDEKYGQQIAELKETGLITEDDNYLNLTTDGMVYVYNVCKKFYTDNNYKKAQPIGLILEHIAN